MDEGCPPRDAESHDESPARHVGDDPVVLRELCALCEVHMQRQARPVVVAADKQLRQHGPRRRGRWCNGGATGTRATC